MRHVFEIPVRDYSPVLLGIYEPIIDLLYPILPKMRILYGH